MASDVMAACQPGAHVFTPLFAGWEPDALTPCDCGAVSWAQDCADRLRAATEQGLAREATVRHAGTPPGPNPEVCDVCGSRMSRAILGRRQLWVRTCTAPCCRYATHSAEAPVEATPGPIAFARAGDLPFVAMERIARRPLEDVAYDARQRQTGERE